MSLKKTLLAIGIFSTSVFAMEGKNMTVYKSPYCGCCTQWIDIMQNKGFNVTTKKVDNVNEIKAKVGITRDTASCHTAIVDGYIVEGHVNYSAIKKMLENKPEIKGLTVPGMPIGSPGMEQGNIKQPYNILYINEDGSTGVYEKY